MAWIHDTCGGVHSSASLLTTSKQTTMHQVCWSLCDWLSLARNSVRCTSKPTLIGWVEPKKLRVGKSCFYWLLLPSAAGEWVSGWMAVGQLGALTIWENLLYICRFSYPQNLSISYHLTWLQEEQHNTHKTNNQKPQQQLNSNSR